MAKVAETATRARVNISERAGTGRAALYLVVLKAISVVHLHFQEHCLCASKYIDIFITKLAVCFSSTSNGSLRRFSLT